MRRRAFLQLTTAATLATTVRTAAPTVAQDLPQGEIDLPHVSGATLVRDRLVLVTQTGGVAAAIPNPLERLRSGSVKVAPEERLDGSFKGKLQVEDLEAVCWDGAEHAYAVTSHSRDIFGEAPEPRYRLVRLTFDMSGKLAEVLQTDALLQGIVNEIPFLADSVRRTAAKSGLNIEGMTWDPRGHLVIGLRSPTVTESRPRPHGGQEDAVVLRVNNPTDLFSGRPERAQFEPVVKLDLCGQGIRAMAYDAERQGFWLISGLSPKPTHPVTGPWALWLWDGVEAPREAAVPASVKFQQPTAVCVLPIGDQNHLLLLEGGKSGSRYALLPPPSTVGV